jgi:hypothetical protein
VAVLFLFVVMMLDVDFAELRQGFLNYLPVGFLVGTILLAELLFIVGAWVIEPGVPKAIAVPIPSPSAISNTQALGLVLYTRYVYFFEAAGVILLVAMLMLADEIAKVENAGLSKHTKIHLRRGAGAYICGEESAMIESIEGKRGLPRNRPPYVAQVGLFGRPTLEQNVETLFWIRDIIERGPAWMAAQGRHERKGFPAFPCRAG